MPSIFKGKKLAPCYPFLIFSYVLFFKLFFSFSFLVWPIVPKVPQVYSRCGAAMVCTWSSSKQKKDLFFGWMWLDHPSCLIRLVSNTEQEPCAWNVSMVWKRASWRIILWWVKLDNCIVVHKHLKKISSILLLDQKIVWKRNLKKNCGAYELKFKQILKSARLHAHS